MNRIYNVAFTNKVQLALHESVLTPEFIKQFGKDYFGVDGPDSMYEFVAQFMGRYPDASFVEGVVRVQRYIDKAGPSATTPVQCCVEIDQDVTTEEEK